VDGVTLSSRPSRAGILAQLKLAAKKGDRVALTLATEQMKLWAFSPRYWERYLDLLAHPLARLVDLTVIKQGEKIARQKGWVIARRKPAKPTARVKGPAARPSRITRVRAGPTAQASLFPDLP
jgi:sugar/nucleoside kinase (ribokinase family)